MKTPLQRKNYIDTKRRTQPLEELLRKAKKANRRGWKKTFSGVEGADYTIAEYWQHKLSHHESFASTFKNTFCSLCGRFASEIGQPVPHLIRCAANPVDDGPYPGWAATRGEYDVQVRKDG